MKFILKPAPTEVPETITIEMTPADAHTLARLMGALPYLAMDAAAEHSVYNLSHKDVRSLVSRLSATLQSLKSGGGV